MSKPKLVAMAALIAAFLIVVGLRNRERHGGVPSDAMGSVASPASKPSPPGPAEPLPAAGENSSLLTPPKLSRMMPVAYLGDHQQTRVFKGRRPVVDDATVLEELGKPIPRFGGPWPTSLSDVPMTAELRRRIDYLEPLQPMPGDDYINETLGFLARLRTCLEAAGVKGPGAVMMDLYYKVDQTTHVGESTSVIPAASSLPEGEDQRFYECAVSSHVGRTMPFSETYASPALSIAATINVPVTNNQYYRNLFGPGPTH
jgi:hypothetical protein